jgi:SAM-dependent methyltransferase
MASLQQATRHSKFRQQVRRTAGRAANVIYFGAGLGFLALAALKHWLEGYRTPKPFGFEDIDRCIDHDIDIVKNWIAHLSAYGGSIEGKDVLELGPGSDLGTGACLLSRGARSYRAFDRHSLASRVPPEFYRRLSRLFPVDQAKLIFEADADFDLSRLPPQSIDLIVSNAAFEHFDDVPRTIRQLSDLVRPGGQIVTVIDLQTHSRWIREVDPANIYRFPDWIYRLFYFSGQPNRVRAYQYRQHFEENGWRNVRVAVEASCNASHVSVHRQFRGPENEIDQLSICLCATRR